jgi:hypothetical protein
LEEIMTWFRRATIRRIALLLPVLALFALGTACGDFWVSQNSTSTVAVSPNTVMLHAAASSTTPGDSYTLSLTATTVGGTQTDETTSATWTSSNTAAVTVSQGQLSAVGNAASNVTITGAFDGQSGTCKVMVYTGTAPSTLTVNYPSSIIPASVATGAQFQVTAVASINGNTNTNVSSYVTWTSNATSIATVDVNGNVTVLQSQGTFTITATANLGSSTGSPTTVTGTSTTFTVI